jgi:Tfp pilus assembly protein PilO
LVRKFDDLSARTQGLVFVLLTLLVLSGAWRTWLAPERLALESRKARLAAILAEIVKLRATAIALPSAQRELRTLEARFTRAEQSPAVPSEQILTALHDAAIQSGIELTSFSGAAPPSVPGPQAARTGVESPRIQLELEGGFHELVAFLERLIALPRVASVSGITVKPLTRQSGRRTIAATIVVATSDQNTFTLGDVPVTYSGAGRRDPFQGPVDVIPAAGELLDGVERGTRAGLSSVAVSDVAVRGIARSGDAMTAILETADRRTFIARAKDRLLDAVVVRIDAQGVVFGGGVDRAHSPALSEIRKNLAPNSGARR